MTPQCVRSAGSFTRTRHLVRGDGKRSPVQRHLCARREEAQVQKALPKPFRNTLSSPVDFYIPYTSRVHSPTSLLHNGPFALVRAAVLSSTPCHRGALGARVMQLCLQLSQRRRRRWKQLIRHVVRWLQRVVDGRHDSGLDLGPGELRQRPGLGQHVPRLGGQHVDLLVFQWPALPVKRLLHREWRPGPDLSRALLRTRKQ